MKHAEDKSKFEQHLEKLAPPLLDPNWRAGILATAAAQESTGLRWLIPKPLAVGLAAAWLLIGLLNLASPSEPEPSARVVKKNPPSPALARSYFETQQRLYAFATSAAGQEGFYE